MEGVGVVRASELVMKTMEDIAPTIFERIAGICGFDHDSVEGRVKPGEPVCVWRFSFEE